MKKLLALLLALLGFAATSCECYYGPRPVDSFEEKEVTEDSCSEISSEQAVQDAAFVEECVEE